jgi:hypothetical protein
MKETRQQFDARMYIQGDPAPEQAASQELDKRSFWFMWVPLGALGAFLLTMWAGSGGVFLPAWFVITMLLWGAFGGTK